MVKYPLYFLSVGTLQSCHPLHSGRPVKHSGGFGGHSGGVVDISGREVYHFGELGVETGGLAWRSVAVVECSVEVVERSGGDVGCSGGHVGNSGELIWRSGELVGCSGRLVVLPRIKICENVAGPSRFRPWSVRPRPDKRFERRDASRNGLARDAPATFMPEHFHKSFCAAV